MILLNKDLFSGVIKFFSYEKDPIPYLLKKKGILGCFLGGTILTMGARFTKSYSVAPYFVITGAGLVVAGIVALVSRRVLSSFYGEEKIRVAEAARVVARGRDEAQTALREAVREKEIERLEIERMVRRKEGTEADFDVERQKFRDSMVVKTRVERLLREQREREDQLEEKKRDAELLKEEAQQRNQTLETEAFDRVSEILRFKRGEADKDPTKKRLSDELEKLEKEKEAFKERVGWIDKRISFGQEEITRCEWALRGFGKNKEEVEKISEERARVLIGLMSRFSDFEIARWRGLEGENSAHKKVFSEWVDSYRQERNLLKKRIGAGNYKIQDPLPIALGNRFVDERTRGQVQEANFSKRASDSRALIAGCKDFIESFKDSPERREALSLLEEVDKIAVFLKQASISLEDEKKVCGALEESFYFFPKIKGDSFGDRLIGLTNYFREKIKKIDEELETFEDRKKFLEKRLREENLPKDLRIREELLRG